MIRKQVLQKITNTWSIWLFGAESLFTLWVSYAFFSGPMHDIAIDYLGHHGRFGAVNLNNGTYPYLINDITLPLILFVPTILLGIVYFMGRQRDSGNLCSG